MATRLKTTPIRNNPETKESHYWWLSWHHLEAFFSINLMLSSGWYDSQHNIQHTELITTRSIKTVSIMELIAIRSLRTASLTELNATKH